MLFLCMLPSTVQSSIAFTSIARGNVPAAVCSASASNLLGIFLTPLLVGLLRGAWRRPAAARCRCDGAASSCSCCCRSSPASCCGPGSAPGSSATSRCCGYVDQGSILLVVYTAFSEAVIEGMWQQLPATALAGLLVICADPARRGAGAPTWSAARLGFYREDEITIVFCGSKKSLASGVPMAKVLFAGRRGRHVVLPLMLFHQIQLMVCAVLAQRYARRETVLVPKTIQR